MNQLYVYIYLQFFGFPSHLGHHRAVSGVPCAIQLQLFLYIIFLSLWLACRYRTQPNCTSVASEPCQYWILEGLKQLHPDTLSRNTELAQWPISLYAIAEILS